MTSTKQGPAEYHNEAPTGIKVPAMAQASEKIEKGAASAENRKSGAVCARKNAKITVEMQYFLKISWVLDGGSPPPRPKRGEFPPPYLAGGFLSRGVNQ